MLDQLERRVERLEGDTLIIKDKLTELSIRSETFATKSDLAELKGELRSDLVQVKGGLSTDLAQVKGGLSTDLAQVKGGLSTDLAELKSELKSDISSLEVRMMVNMMQAINNSQNAIMEKMDRRFDRVDDNTKWRLSGVILPVGSVIVTAVVAFLIAKYVSH
ncbi:DUF1640 domain-containing protein [Salmonella enterica]|nr:DUF1640 domain-containing protein [Salmonella enterica]EMD3666500.1 DUF1640 domain-containing protein [Salmonella enterica]